MLIGELTEFPPLINIDVKKQQLRDTLHSTNLSLQFNTATPRK